MPRLYVLGWQMTEFQPDRLRLEPWDRKFDVSELDSVNFSLPCTMAPGLTMLTLDRALGRVILNGHQDLSSYAIRRCKWLYPNCLPAGSHLSVHVELAPPGESCGAEEGSALPSGAGDAGAAREPPAPERGAVPVGHEGGVNPLWIRLLARGWKLEAEAHERDGGEHWQGQAMALRRCVAIVEQIVGELDELGEVLKVGT